MKTINAMTINELAEYVVTLPGFDWALVSGAKERNGWRRLSAGPDAHVLTEEQAEEWDWAGYEAGRVMRVSLLGQYIDDYSLEDGLDLNDNATTGCLLAMVRKRLGEHVTSMRRLQGWNVVEYMRLEAIHLAYSYDTWGFMPLLAGEYKTEAHALVAALAKDANQ